MKVLLWICLFTLAAIASTADRWNADAEKARITFSVGGPFGTVHGKFSGLKATIQFSEKDPGGSSISASIDAKTVSTGISLRNSDLRKKELWLNADKYPTIRFTSKKIEKTSGGYKVLGNLTLKATSLPIEIPFTFTSKENSGVFKGQFAINREDYKIGKKGGSVGEKITINIEVPVSKATNPSAK